MFKSVVLAISGVMAAASVQAATLTYEWSATVNRVTTSASGLSSGQTITGSLKLNTEAPAYARYDGVPGRQYGGRPSLDSTPAVEAFAISGISLDVDASRSYASVANDAYYTVRTGRYSYSNRFQDGWTVHAFGSSGSPIASLFIYNSLGDRGVVSSYDLSSGIDFGKANVRVFSVRAGGEEFNGTIDSFVLKDVPSIAAVPVPAPVIFLLTSIAGLGLLRRRKSIA